MNETKTPATPQNEEPWEPNPALRLERGFERIWKTRMMGLPMLHPRVRVQAVGFRRWKYFWLGVIVTPWCMNLILSKGQPSKWKSVAEGRRLNYPFPAGLYDFICVRRPHSRRIPNVLTHVAALMKSSPIMKWRSEIAKYALEELMKPAAEPELGTPIPAFEKEADPEAIEKAVSAAIERPIPRRAFLRPRKKEEEE